MGGIKISILIIKKNVKPGVREFIEQMEESEECVLLKDH